MGITLTDHQWSGVKKSSGWYSEASRLYTPDYDNFYGTIPTQKSVRQDFVFGGYAGSGKSTCVGAMIEDIGLTEDSVMYMAPTGKAAKILTGKLRDAGWGQPATTIHKAIYMPRRTKSDQINKDLKSVSDAIAKRENPLSYKPDIFPDMDLHDLMKRRSTLENALREAMDNDGPSFTLKSPADLPPGIKLFVVDEASMVGTFVADDLRRFGIPILAVGDPGQLPPVGDTWGFNMENPDVFLTEIHRQAAENPILRLATMARKDQLIKAGDYGDGVTVVERRNDNATLDMDRDAMVLVGTHKKRWNVTSKIREALGFTENGPMKGEPILVRRNSKAHPGLVNGSLLLNQTDHGALVGGNTRMRLELTDPDAENMAYSLTCAQCFFEEHIFRKADSYSGQPRDVFSAKMDCEQLDWGHVLTVHKSQGSEWDDVVIHDESGSFRKDGPRWLYTGITRAAKQLTIVL